MVKGSKAENQLNLCTKKNNGVKEKDCDGKGQQSRKPENQLNLCTKKNNRVKVKDFRAKKKVAPA